MVWAKFREYSNSPKDGTLVGSVMLICFFISNRLWNLGLLQKKKVDFPVNSWCIERTINWGDWLLKVQQS